MVEALWMETYQMKAALAFTASQRFHYRVVNGPHFEAQTRPEPEITSPNPARHSFSKPDLGPKAKLLSEPRYAQLQGIKKRSLRV